MAGGFGLLRRIAALSVAINLIAAPIASAQSPESAPPSSASSNTPLLSPMAFARLIQPAPTDVAPPPVAADSLRPSLLSQATASMVREARATAAKAPQSTWGSRHPTAKQWVIAGVVIGAIFGAIGITLGALYGD